MATGSNNNGVTISSADAFFKQWYLGGGGLNRLMYESDPFLGRLKRLPATTITGGDEIVVPIRVGRSPTQSKKFADAQKQAQARTGERKKWILTVDDEHGVIRVSNKSIYASQNDRGAFVRLLRDEADSCIEGVNQRRCTALFAGKAGLAGTVRSRSGATITLSLAHQSTAFDIGDQVEARAPAGTLRAGGIMEVTKVNRATGVLTMAATVNAAVAANDELYREGDYGVSAMTGLNSWIPKTLTGLGTLNNIDRTQDPLRLAGHRLQMDQDDRFDDSVRKLCAQINQLTGKNPTIAVMSPLVENLFAVEQRAQIRFDNASGSGAAMTIGAGVGGLSIKTAKGDVELVTSAFAPVDTIWVLNEMDLALYYLSEKSGDFVFFKQNPETGSIFKTAHNSSGIEARIESYGNFAMQAPGLHGRIDLHSSKVPTFN